MTYIFTPLYKIENGGLALNKGWITWYTAEDRLIDWLLFNGTRDIGDDHHH